MSLKALALQCLARNPDKKLSGNLEETFDLEKALRSSPEHQDILVKNVSYILSALYRQKSPSEWEWLRLNRPDWWRQRVRLENDLDGHFLTGDQKAGQEVFYRLMKHLKTAPVSRVSAKK